MTGRPRRHCPTPEPGGAADHAKEILFGTPDLRQSITARKADNGSLATRRVRSCSARRSRVRRVDLVRPGDVTEINASAGDLLTRAPFQQQVPGSCGDQGQRSTQVLGTCCLGGRFGSKSRGLAMISAFAGGYETISGRDARRTPLRRPRRQARSGGYPQAGRGGGTHPTDSDTLMPGIDHRL